VCVVCVVTDLNGEGRTLLQVIHNGFAKHRPVGEKGDQKSLAFGMIVDQAEVLAHEDLSPCETHPQNTQLRQLVQGLEDLSSSALFLDEVRLVVTVRITVNAMEIAPIGQFHLGLDHLSLCACMGMNPQAEISVLFLLDRSVLHFRLFP